MSEARSAQVAFIGLGNMGGPMSKRLVDAGFDVVGFDPVEDARRSLVAAGGRAAPSVAEAAKGAGTVILMLPSSAVVEAVLADALDVLAPGTVVVDMSTSEPMSTRRLAGELAAKGVTLVDAPVSGGVPRAQTGKLTIMAGGAEPDVATVEPLLAHLGSVQRAGEVGAGHALKAINNMLSAVHLLATAEGVAAGQRFGLDPEVMIAMINTSSGRSGSTENKFPNYVLPKTFDSGFALSLMLKDMRIAAGLADELGVPAPLGNRAVELWAAADAELGAGADHTEIARWVLDRPALDVDHDELRERIVELHGSWGPQWQAILDLEPDFLAAYVRMAAVPARKQHLDAKSRDLIYLAVDAAATHLQPDGIRMHVRNALAHGASKEEIAEVIELVSTLGIHAMNIGVPLLTEVLSEQGRRTGPAELDEYQQQLKDRFTANRGYWHPFWNEILELDPEMFEAYTDFSSVPWETGVLSPKMKEFVYIAFDAAATHLYRPGWKLHMENALGYGATVGEIVEVMEIASMLGMKAATTAFPILAEELRKLAGEG
jgi:3-hydroxyisobutyrate dehydrogenase-like beta-hydroxyacid dehydrogenase/alkylhydroperoxidase/carboxymuconolactone decarboxylase family protein YurZ